LLPFYYHCGARAVSETLWDSGNDGGSYHLAV